MLTPQQANLCTVCTLLQRRWSYTDRLLGPEYLDWGQTREELGQDTVPGSQEGGRHEDDVTAL